LPEASVCLATKTAAIAAPVDPALAERVNRGAALGAALLRAGKAAQAKATVDALLAEPAIVADAASAARLGVLAAQSERQLGHDQQAADRLDAAYLAARTVDTRESMLAVANEYVARHLGRREPAPTLQWIARARLEAETLGDARALALLDGREARALHHRGDFDEAIVRSEAALAGLAALGLSDSADAVDIKSSLGGVYFAQRRFDRALAIKTEAIEQQTRIHGAEHPLTAAAISDLGVIESATGDLAGARKHLEQALGILERTLVEPNPRIGDTLAQLAGLRLREHDAAAAIALGERALANLTPSQEDSSAVALVLNNHALALLEADRRTEGIAMLRRSVAMKERVLPPNHPDLALAYSNLGEALALEPANDPADTTALYRKALAIRSTRDDAQTLAHARALLAAWLAEHDGEAEARSLAQLVLDEPTTLAADRIAALFALARASTGSERRTRARDALAIAEVERSEFLARLRVLAD
ncbi:MAG TPA: tetratricopeptide repeat protein, partial [Nannocystaceae bacterium]|nr:tetratricopeptide repeat protein [Nannocystaceae bacterium]